jgi:hypothetical protein
MIRDDILYPGFDQTVAIDNLDNKFAVHTKVGPWSIYYRAGIFPHWSARTSAPLWPRDKFSDKVFPHLLGFFFIVSKWNQLCSKASRYLLSWLD